MTKTGERIIQKAASPNWGLCKDRSSRAHSVDYFRFPV